MFVEHKEAGESTPVLDDASRLLLRAAALIEERGWCQGAYFSGERLCAMGALHMASGGRIGDAFTAVGSVAIERLWKKLPTVIPDWNDRPGRTKEEVVAKLRAVALGG